MKVEDLSCPTEVYVLTGSVSVAMVTSSLVHKALLDIFYPSQTCVTQNKLAGSLLKSYHSTSNYFKLLQIIAFTLYHKCILEQSDVSIAIIT